MYWEKSEAREGGRGGVRVGLPVSLVQFMKRRMWETHCAAPPAGQNKLPHHEVSTRHCPVLGIQSIRHTLSLITLRLQSITGQITEEFHLCFFIMCHCLVLSALRL